MSRSAPRRRHNMQYGFGIDVGGTTCKMGLFDKEGVLVEKWEIPTNKENNGENVLSDIARAVEDKLVERGIDKTNVYGVGVGLPGPVTADGVVNKLVNIGWGKKAIVKELQELLGLPVKAGNDANVAALGELVHGSGRGKSSLVMVTLGTGVGGGVIVDGRIVHGATGAGGEIGHIMVNDQETAVCGCGKTGCLEQYVSATGIARMATEMRKTTNKKTRLTSENITAKDVFDAAKEDDELALEVVENVGKILGKALANVAGVINPEIIVIGGGVSKAGAILTDVVSKYFREYAFHACKDTEISLAKLGNDAGIYGCVGMLL